MYVFPDFIGVIVAQDSNSTSSARKRSKTSRVPISPVSSVKKSDFTSPSRDLTALADEAFQNETWSGDKQKKSATKEKAKATPTASKSSGVIRRTNTTQPPIPSPSVVPDSDDDLYDEMANNSFKALTELEETETEMKDIATFDPAIPRTDMDEDDKPLSARKGKTAKKPVDSKPTPQSTPATNRLNRKTATTKDLIPDPTFETETKELTTPAKKQSHTTPNKLSSSSKSKPAKSTASDAQSVFPSISASTSSSFSATSTASHANLSALPDPSISSRRSTRRPTKRSVVKEKTINISGVESDGIVEQACATFGKGWSRVDELIPCSHLIVDDIAPKRTIKLLFAIVRGETSRHVFQSHSYYVSSSYMY